MDLYQLSLYTNTLTFLLCIPWSGYTFSELDPPYPLSLSSEWREGRARATRPK
jgi:hypothetical protein